MEYNARYFLYIIIIRLCVYSWTYYSLLVMVYTLGKQHRMYEYTEHGIVTKYACLKLAHTKWLYAFEDASDAMSVLFKKKTVQNIMNFVSIFSTSCTVHWLHSQ